MGTITHFELTSASPEATSDFYTRAFGWTATPSPFLPDYHTVATGDGDGIDGAVMSNRYQSQNTIMWIRVEDIAAAREAVEAAGGATAGDVHDLPGEGRVGYVTDPDGVLIGLKQPA